MNREPAVEFVLQDREEGVELTPSTIGLSRFNEFNQQVQDFLVGSERLKVDDVHLHVSVESGSYKLVVQLPVYEPGYNESALDEFVAAGSKAWADVSDAAGWVRELRGGSVR